MNNLGAAAAAVVAARHCWQAVSSQVADVVVAADVDVQCQRTAPRNQRAAAVVVD